MNWFVKQFLLRIVRRAIADSCHAGFPNPGAGIQAPKRPSPQASGPASAPASKCPSFRACQRSCLQVPNLQGVQALRPANAQARLSAPQPSKNRFGWRYLTADTMSLGRGRAGALMKVNFGLLCINGTRRFETFYQTVRATHPASPRLAYATSVHARSPATSAREVFPMRGLP